MLMNLLGRDLPPEEVAAPPSASRIKATLPRGTAADDLAFDAFLPPELQAVSIQYWTPLAVTARVAEWFDELGVQTVVDIGSGAGKFCVAAALAGRARYTGIEQRARLVGVARGLAGAFELGDRVTFIHGSFGECSAPEAEAYYLFNPFGENLFGAEDHLDEDVELSDDRYRRDIRAVEAMLRRAKAGTCLVTYNGFGGTIPEDYRAIYSDHTLRNDLHLWRKSGPTSPR